jgi:hypothetical protein
MHVKLQHDHLYSYKTFYSLYFYISRLLVQSTVALKVVASLSRALNSAENTKMTMTPFNHNVSEANRPTALRKGAACSCLDI